MASPDKRRQQVLAGILLVLVVVLFWRFRGVLVPGAGGGEIAGEIASMDEQVQRLQNLPAIGIERPALDTGYRPKRNLFRFSDSPEAIAQRLAEEERQRLLREQAAAQAVEQAKKREEAVARRAQVKQPPPAPRKPEFGYTYVAYLGELSDPLNYFAVLQKPGAARRDKKKEDILVVRAGEKIDEHFVVKTISIDQLVVGYLDARFEKDTRVVNLVQPKEPSRR